ncbi:MAG: hypothetical protein NTY83_01015 [Candidatus Micrarchaeota archaeon]|nr:hypothetical protein [Candidatus Micrarchaeota archaeon]
MAKLTPRDIGALIEVRKKVAELTFKKGRLQRSGEGGRDLKEIEDELNRLGERKAALERKTDGIEIFMPFQKRLEELRVQISTHDDEDVAAAMRAKDGELYQMLKEKGAILKKNMEARNEIGKIILMMQTAYPALRARIVEAVKEGKAPEMEVAELAGKEGKIVASLNRIGIGCRLKEGKIAPSEEPWNEAKVLLNNAHIWIPRESLDKFVQNEAEMELVGIKLQVKNAEKQVKTFDESEMKVFKDLQTKYIDLLKARKDITDVYEKEFAGLELS